MLISDDVETYVYKLLQESSITDDEYEFISRISSENRPTHAENEDKVSVISESTISAVEEVALPRDEHNYFTSAESNSTIVMSPKSALNFAANEINVMKGENDMLLAENVRLRQGVFDAKKARFSFENIRHDNRLVKIHTGVPSTEFLCIFSRKWSQGFNECNILKALSPLIRSRIRRMIIIGPVNHAYCP